MLPLYVYHKEGVRTSSFECLCIKEAKDVESKLREVILESNQRVRRFWKVDFTDIRRPTRAVDVVFNDLIWAVLSDEQMRKIWPFSLLNDEQMSNKVGVKHQPVIFSRK